MLADINGKMVIVSTIRLVIRRNSGLVVGLTKSGQEVMIDHESEQQLHWMKKSYRERLHRLVSVVEEYHSFM